MTAVLDLDRRMSRAAEPHLYDRMRDAHRQGRGMALLPSDIPLMLDVIRHPKIAERIRARGMVELRKAVRSSAACSTRVYFIRSGGGHIKIGLAQCVLSRLGDLQTAHALPLELLGSLPGDFAMERFLHAVFAEDRVRGEWFDPSPRLLDFIAHTVRR